MLIAVIRYPEREADVVISLNTPVFISEHRCTDGLQCCCVLHLQPYTLLTAVWH